MATAPTAPPSITDLCIICQALTDNKPKPGILPCLGCQQLFCYQHIGQHRRDLGDQLDTIVVNERNNLLETISKLEENCDQYTVQHVKEIDDWELKSCGIIKQMAENARHKLHEMALNQCDNFRAQFSLLSAELSKTRETDSYFEKDIEVLKHKFHQLKYDTENFGLKVDTNNELHMMELIDIKRKPSSSDSFIDHLMLTQKPTKSITVRNIGELYAVNENLLAFEHGGARDIDLYNTVGGSLRTLSRKDENGSHVCYSTCLQSFLYLIRRRRPEWYDLYQWSITFNSEPKLMDLKSSEKISEITCYETNLIVVSRSNTIEKWKLNSLQLDARWRTPMSCEQDESIVMIRMNSQHYGLVIKNVDEYRFELRNLAMSLIGSVKIIYDYSLQLTSLPHDSGWLFFYRYRNENDSYVIDNQLNKYEQKYLSRLNIQNIAVQGTNVIIHYFEQANNVTKAKKCPIEYYQWK